MKHSTTENTLWVFFLTARGNEPEKRHLMDVAFGVYSLLSTGISVQDLRVLVDGKDNQAKLELFSEYIDVEVPISITKEFPSVLQEDSKYKHLYVFVFGHGSMAGIASEPDITPYNLVTSIKSSNFSTAVVVLGVCYAGLFNFINATCEVRDDNTKTPELVLMGSTSLHSAIATSISQVINKKNVTWVSNIFLNYLFRWFSDPVDMDGDGHYSLMDAYKYAGLMTNEKNQELRIKNFADLLNDSKEIDKKMKAHKERYNQYVEFEKGLKTKIKKTLSKKHNNKLRRKKRLARRIWWYKFRIEYLQKLMLKEESGFSANYTKRERLLSVNLFNTQEPWVLNSWLAQEFEYIKKVN